MENEVKDVNLEENANVENINVENAENESSNDSKKPLSNRTKIIIAIVAALLCAGIVVCLVLCTGKKGSSIENEYVKISKYIGIETEDTDNVSVTDEDVDSKIEEEMSANETKSEITDRAAKIGDFVNVDYKGTVNGEAFDGGEASDTEIEITEDGTGYIEGFVAGIVGHKTGEEFDVNVTFPDDYQAENLKGKAAVFHFKLNSVYSKIAPKLDDKYVKENVDGCKTVKEYKKKVKKDLLKQKKEESKSSKTSSVWEQVLKNTKVKKYPKKEMDKIVNNYKKTYENYAKESNMSFEEFLKQQVNMSQKDFEDEVKNAARNQVKTKLVVEAICEEEDLKLTDKEFKKELKKLAKQSGFDSSKKFLDSYKDSMTKDDFRSYFETKLAQDFVVDKSVVKKAKSK